MTILSALLIGLPGRFLPRGWSALAAPGVFSTGKNGQIELISDGERLWINAERGE